MTALTRRARPPRPSPSPSPATLTCFDALLPSIGPQDGEQSIPDFIAAGLDFPDWVELAAPRPYAIISTYSRHVPLRRSPRHRHRSPPLLRPLRPRLRRNANRTTRIHPASPPAPRSTPTPSNTIPATAALQLITGTGGHGNLGPITRQIVCFFMTHLGKLDTAHPILPPPPRTRNAARSHYPQPSKRRPAGHPHRPGRHQLPRQRNRPLPQPETRTPDRSHQSPTLQLR